MLVNQQSLISSLHKMLKNASSLGYWRFFVIDKYGFQMKLQ